jgi:phosphoribosylformylglycinamidine synthase
MKAKIIVTPRAEVLDPQGEAVRQGLVSLGYTGVNHVRVGRYLELEVEGTDQELVSSTVRSMCEKLLANEVIEDFDFVVEP